MIETKKSNPFKTFLTIVISLLLAGLFMGLALRGLEFGKIKESLLEANYWWVIASAFFAVLAYWVRAIRWNLLLEPMGYTISNSNSLWTIAFGYLMNLTIPRSGELARATALYGVEKVPVNQSFGTIILERIIDFVCMLLLLGLTLIFKYEAVYGFYRLATENKSENKFAKPSRLDHLLHSLGIENLEYFYFYSKVFIGALVILGMVLLFIYKKDKILSFTKGLLEGLMSIFKLKNKSRFIFLSLSIWVCYYLAAYLACFALKETSAFTIADGFYVIVVGTLGMMVPASGGIGAFHFALKIGISALFLSTGKSAEEGAEVGLSYAFLSHSLQMVIMIGTGVISIFMLAKGRNQQVIKD